VLVKAENFGFRLKNRKSAARTSLQTCTAMFASLTHEGDLANSAQNFDNQNFNKNSPNARDV
jgi:hypothetical protein